MKVERFILHTKRNPMKYINYCEIIIEPDGEIRICKGCHVMMMAEYGRKQYIKETGKEIDKTSFYQLEQEYMNEIGDYFLPLEYFCDKYQLIPVWYNGYMYSVRGITKEQESVIKKLIDEGLITSCGPYIQMANCYTNSVNRNKKDDSSIKEGDKIC